MVTNTPLASTGWATGKGIDAASLCAMALAWAARVVQASSRSMPIQGAARKRPLEGSWPACFRRASKRCDKARSNSTTASDSGMPALVPPMTRMSTPSDFSAFTSKPEATALASRAPSRCTGSPHALAWAASAPMAWAV